MRCSLLLGLLVPAIGRAQAWQQALAGSGGQPRFGGTSEARATAVDASGNVFIAGNFTGQVAFGATLLTSAGGTDVFIAKWNATTASWAWATSAGGTDSDNGNGIAVVGSAVYVAGDFLSGTTARFAGAPLAGAGSQDMFLAKYFDDGTSVRNGWATSGGGLNNDAASSVAASSSGVYVTGYYYSGSATFAGAAVAGGSLYLAKYTDTGTAAGSGWAATSQGNAVSNALAVSGNNIYVTGYFPSTTTIAGTTLAIVPGYSSDTFIAKYVDQGTSFANGWAVRQGGPGVDYGQGIAVSGSNIYLTGAFDTPGLNDRATYAGTSLQSAGLTDAFVAKYTDTGTGLSNGWATSGGGYRSDWGYAIAASAGGVYVTGFLEGSARAQVAGTSLTVPGYRLNVFVAKYIDTGTGFSNGWAAAGGEAGSGQGDDIGRGLAVSGSAVYVAAGTGATVARFGPTAAGLLSPPNAAMLGRLDAGTGTWQQIEGPLQGGNSSGAAVATDASGNVLLTGSFSGTVGFGATRLTSLGGTDIFVAKWNATTASWAWAVRDGGPADDTSYGIAANGGNIYVAGSFTNATTLANTALTAAGSRDVFIAKYTDAPGKATGTWAVRAGGTGPDNGYSIASVGASVYVVGTFASGTSASFAGLPLAGAGGQDVFLAKYLDNGPSASGTWATSGGGSGDDDGRSVAASGTSVYVAGAFISSTNATVAGTGLLGTGGADMFLAKYFDDGTSVRSGWATSGGGWYADAGYGVAANGPNVYVTGSFTSGSRAAIAGTSLSGAGAGEVFLAKYTDMGTGFSNGWAVSGGSFEDDSGYGVAVNGTSVYVTGACSKGYFAGQGPVIAGQSLSVYGVKDVFVAKYYDDGTSVRNGWATSGGGADEDSGYGLALSGNRISLAATVLPAATFGTIRLAQPERTPVYLFGQLGDAVLATAPATPITAPQLFPNPAYAGGRLAGAVPGTTLRVLDTLGRTLTVATADATGSLLLPVGLPAGLYIVQSSTGSTKLLVR